MAQRVLVVAFAFACEPGRGSEPGVGFAFARALAELTLRHEYDVVLLTRPHRAARVEEELAREFPGHRVEVQRVSIPLALVRVTKRERVRLAYLYWQALAVRRARGILARAEQPAVVHHITFASDVMSTWEGALPREVPRIFGPAGSSQELNRQLWSRRKVFVNDFLRKGLARRNLAGVDTLICQNEQVAAEWEGIIPKTVVEPNILLPEKDVARAHGGSRDPRLLACVGLLTERKQPVIALKALAKLPPDYSLVFVGDGELREELRQLAASLGVEERVEFAGNVTHQQALERVGGAGFLLHPSRQEGAGWVIGEAQTMGAWPVVIAGSGGDTTVREAGIGSVVPAGSQDSIASAMAAAVQDNVGRPVPATARWSAERVPELLHVWYSEALSGTRREPAVTPS